MSNEVTTSTKPPILKPLCFSFNGSDYVAIVNVNVHENGLIEAVELRRIYLYYKALSENYIFKKPCLLNPSNVLELINNYPAFNNENSVGFISDYNETANLLEDSPILLKTNAEDELIVDEPDLIEVSR